MNRSETLMNVASKVTERFNPVLSGPSAPLKTRALFAAFGPSLMPRAAMHQGIAAGLSLLAGELVGRGVDAGIRRVVPDSSPFAIRMGARAVATGAGLALSRIPETDDEPTAKASVRAAGRLVAAGAAGVCFLPEGSLAALDGLSVAIDLGLATAIPSLAVTGSTSAVTGSTSVVATD